MGKSDLEQYNEDAFFNVILVILLLAASAAGVLM